MRTIITAALAAVSQAAESDFPKFDSLHAGCQISSTYSNTACDTIYTMIDAEVRSFATADPAKGQYALYEESEPDYVWSTRRTSGGKYVDDQIFELTQNGNNCDVLAKSRSQSHSYYDYDTNYCNMWNVMNAVGGMGPISRKHCTFYPSKPEETCLEY